MAEEQSQPEEKGEKNVAQFAEQHNRYLVSNARNEYYNMMHKYRGSAIIFSHDRFDTNLQPRSGAKRDCDNLDKCLKTLGFRVHIYHNLKYKYIMKQIKQAVQMNHYNNDCLVVFVLTHGFNGMLCAKDTHYSVDKLWRLFTEENCPTLADKPKLFFIQACQGEKYDDGMTLTREVETDGWFKSHTVPTHPDFLIVFSTVPGYYSFRNTTNGSWFVQALCEELNSATDMDILTMLTLVCRNVGLNFESNTPDTVDSHEKKQVPCFSSTLTRRLVFTKKS